MWLQTLPDVVQARVLSFLIYEHAKFNKQDLSKLARDMLLDATEVNFWVRRAAHQLFDVVSDSNYKWVSSLNLDSEEEKFDGNFGNAPLWLKDVASANDSVLPWLPISVDELNTGMPQTPRENDEDMMVEVEEIEDGNRERVGNTQRELGNREIDPLDQETEESASCLQTRIKNLESSLKAVELVDDIRKLCVKRKEDSLTVLGLIEPWNADDEVVPIFLSRLLDGNEEDFGWTSNILCSIVLPKFLLLEKPASRVLVTATIEYCKVHHKSAVYALLFPLIFRKEGVNNPICDVITRIVKECLHPAQVSAFCQKLLCEEEEEVENKYICLPCHRYLVSRELVWTEPLFNVFQNILNYNVRLTQDSVDQLISHILEAARRFSKSLKFGNFLLCFVGKCGPLLKVHKVALSEAVGSTSSFLTKSILSKLASI